MVKRDEEDLELILPKKKKLRDLTLRVGFITKTYIAINF